MKKSSLVLMLTIFASLMATAKDLDGAKAKDLYGTKEHPTTPVMISIASPIQLPMVGGDDLSYSVVNRSKYCHWLNLRWNLFYADCHEMVGIDLGMVARSVDKMSGFALESVSWVENNFTGAEIALMSNVVLGDALGFQLAGVGNYVNGAMKGAQIGLFNHNGTFEGFQTGLLNWDKGVCTAFEIGVGNVNTSELHGWSFGLVNYTERLYGLHLGLFNVVSDMGRGVQIGLLNGASKFQGVQIGLLNVIADSSLPVLPIVNGNF